MKKIGLLTPSSAPSTPPEMDLIRAFFETRGFDIVESKNIHAKDRFLAGSDMQRADDLHALFMDPAIDVIMALRGGYGSARLLDLLDFDLIRKNKKPFWGFSDPTALQLALWQRSGIVGITGFSPKRDITQKGVDPLIAKTLDLYLDNKALTIGLSPMQETKSMTGTLLGGTLILIEELIGTPYMPDLKDTILFIEDSMEEPYKIDRMLTHLRLAGVLDQIKALIIGNFYKCISSDPEDGTLAEVFDDLHKRMPQLPIFTGLNYGHGDSRLVLPIGQTVTLENSILSIDYAK